SYQSSSTVPFKALTTLFRWRSFLGVTPTEYIILYPDHIHFSFQIYTFKIESCSFKTKYADPNKDILACLVMATSVSTGICALIVCSIVGRKGSSDFDIPPPITTHCGLMIAITFTKANAR